MFDLQWTDEAIKAYKNIEKQSNKISSKKQKKKSSKQEGLFKQINKTLKHLKTHPYSSLEHPWDDKQKVFEAYVQNKTSAAYRIFWCYGPNKNQITIIAITTHP